MIVFAVVLFVRKIVGESDARARGKRPRVPLEEASVELLRKLFYGKGVLEFSKRLDGITKTTAQDVVCGGWIDIEALTLRGIVLKLASLGLSMNERNAEVAVLVIEEKESLRRQSVYPASAACNSILNDLLGERELDKTARAFRKIALHSDGNDNKRLVGRLCGIGLWQMRDPAKATRLREVCAFVLGGIDGNRLQVGLKRREEDAKPVRCPGWRKMADHLYQSLFKLHQFFSTVTTIASDSAARRTASR